MRAMRWGRCSSCWSCAAPSLDTLAAHLFNGWHGLACHPVVLTNPFWSPSSMPFYSLYANFSKAATAFLNLIRDEIQDMLAEQLAYRVSEDVHITVVYGPALKDGESEAVTVADMATVFPSVGPLAAEAVGTAVDPLGLTHFQFKPSDTAPTVFALQWRSDALTHLRNHLVHAVPELMEARIADNAMRGDDRFAVDLPTGLWAYSTLCVLRPGCEVDTAAATIRAILEGVVLDELRVASVVGISAVTDTPVLLAGE